MLHVQWGRYSKEEAASSFMAVAESEKRIFGKLL